MSLKAAQKESVSIILHLHNYTELMIRCIFLFQGLSHTILKQSHFC